MTDPSSISGDMYKNLFEEAKANLIHLTTLSTNILERISEAIIVTTIHPRYTIVSFNRAVTKQFGIAEEALLRRDLFTTIRFPEEAALRETAIKVLASRNSCALDHTYDLPMRGTRYLETKIHPLTEEKKVTGLIWVTDDVTERTQAESRYQLLVEHVTDVIWTMDMNLRYTYVSPSITRLRGYSVKEAMTQTVEDIFTPASLEVVRKTFVEELAIEAMEQKNLDRTRMLELEQNCKDGATVWTELKMTFLRNPEGHPVGILGVTRDITERKQVEQLRSTLTRTKEYLELRKLLDERLAGEIGLVVITAGAAGPNTLFNKSSLSEEEAFNLTYRGFTILMSGIDYRNQRLTRYAGTIEIPGSEFYCLAFYRTIEGYPEEVQQDPRLKTTVITLLLVLRKQIMAFLLQKFLEIEEFLADATRSWTHLTDLSGTELEIFHEKIRYFMLEITRNQREELLEELAEELLDPDRHAKLAEFALPDEFIGIRLR